MNMKLLSAITLASLSTITSFCAQGALLNNGDVLTITAGVSQCVLNCSDPDPSNQAYDVPTGSYFGSDANDDSNINPGEKFAMAQGTTGLVIGVATTPGAYHIGAPTASDTNAITAPVNYFDNTGSWYTTVPITGGTTGGLDLSGWNFAWSNVANNPQGGLAWQPGNCAVLGCSGHTFTDGNALFQWDGVYGDAYTLDYTSTVQPGFDIGPYNQFYLHLEGTVTSVPLPAGVWLFGSGLLGLIGVARRKAV